MRQRQHIHDWKRQKPWMFWQARGLFNMIGFCRKCHKPLYVPKRKAN